MKPLAACLACLAALSGTAAAADEDRRPPPDPAQGETYDGRAPDPPARDAALVVPRLVLLPLRLVFLVAEPATRPGIEFEQRHHLMKHVYDALTSDDGLVGVRPEFHWSVSFHPSFGLRYYDQRLMGPETLFAAIAAGGPGVAHAEIIGRPTRFSSRVQFDFGAMYDRRDDRLFAGIDNTVPVQPGQPGPSRYESDNLDFSGALGFRLAAPLLLSVGGEFGWRHFGNGTSIGGDLPIDEVWCVRLVNGMCVPGTVDPNLVPGFAQGTQFVRGGATLTLDLRDSPVSSAAGVLVILGADYSHGVGSDESSYFRLHASATLPVNLWARRHVLLFRAATQVLAPVGDAIVPFSELPTLGGPNDLRGFRDQLFHGHSSFIATVEYRFPVWMWMDAFVFADYGGVFGQWYDGFSASQMQPDVGLGLRLFTRRNFYFRTQVAYGWGEGWRLTFSTSNWP